MKILLIELFLVIPFLLNAQNPTIYFDKTRCEKIFKLERIDSLPHPISIHKKLEKVIPSKQLAQPIQFNSWYLYKKDYTPLKKAHISEPLLISKEGKYFIQILGHRDQIFIELNVNNQEIKSSIFCHCVIHD